MHDLTGLVAVVLFFGTGMVGLVALSPIGRAIANAIQKKSGVMLPPEVRDTLVEQAEQLEALQRQIGELAERQDFTERLLAKAREKGQLPAAGDR